MTVLSLIAKTILMLAVIAGGIVCVSAPRRIQQSIVRRNERAPEIPGKRWILAYVSSSGYVWLVRTVGLGAIFIGIVGLVILVENLFGAEVR